MPDKQRLEKLRVMGEDCVPEKWHVQEYMRGDLLLPFAQNAAKLIASHRSILWGVLRPTIMITSALALPYARPTTSLSSWPEPAYNCQMQMRAGKRLVAVGPISLAGFTLVELTIVLFILSLLFVFTMPVSTALLNSQKRDLTKQKMKIVEIALVNFVAVNKRLPCPADGADTVGTELRTTSTQDCTTAIAANTEQKRGVVPWVTLGLTKTDVSDGWENQLTFRVAFGLTREGALDMSACDPVGTANTTPLGVSPLPPTNTVINLNLCDIALTCSGTGSACSNPTMFLANKGFRVVDGADATIMDPSSYTGAAYILVSHGENGVGAFSNSQVVLSSPSIGVDGTLEALNHNNGNAVNSSNTTLSPYFRDATPSWSESASAYFDDIVIRPTVYSTVQRAQLGPRSH